MEPRLWEQRVWVWGEHPGVLSSPSLGWLMWHLVGSWASLGSSSASGVAEALAGSSRSQVNPLEQQHQHPPGTFLLEMQILGPTPNLEHPPSQEHVPGRGGI